MHKEVDWRASEKMRGDRLDLTSEPDFSVRGRVTTRTTVNSLPDASQDKISREPSGKDKPEGRRYVGVRFHCCGVYVRVYVNKSGTAYEGRCPKCAKPVRLKIGDGGTNCRIFNAY